MPANDPTSRIALFGPYVLDGHSGELRKSGIRIKLGEQPLRILLRLIERPGQLVTREELRVELWADQTFVDFEHSLNSAIQRLRDSLSDTADKARWVQTVPRRGYRFVGEVQWQDGAELNSPRSVPLPTQSPTEEVTDAAAPPATGWQAVARRVAVVGLGAVLLLIWPAVNWVRRQGVRPEMQVATIRSVAVLPLEDLSGDPAEGYFADGITELLITELGQVKSLRVISHTSVNQYKGTRKTIPEIARELQVDALVEGTVARSKGRVRVTANLVRAFPEKHLWANAYERDMDDMFTLQSNICEAITHAIQVQLTPEERELLASPHPVNLQAQEAYLKGLFYFARGWDRFFVRDEGQQELHKANDYFQRAIALDPKYAEAYAALARSYLWLSDTDGPSADAGAKAAADKAIALDETLPEPHMVRGFLLLDGTPDWARAEREFLRSIELNPSFAQGHHAYAIYLSSRGRFDQATAEADRAVLLDPISRSPKSQAAWIDVCAGRYDRGITKLQNIVQLYAEDSLSHQGLGIAYVVRGRSEEGIEELRKSAVLAGEDPNRDRYLGWAYAVAGEKKHAIEILDQLKRSSPRDVQAKYGVAVVYAGLGDNDQVFMWLQKAYDERHDVLNDLMREPPFTPLRQDPRFLQLLRKIGAIV